MTRATTSPRPASAAANSAAPRDSMRLAAIDVGSNSVHMIVAQADADGGVTTLWRMKEMVGLGRMSFPSRRLSAEAMDRAIASLARFKQAAQQRQAEKILAVATSAIREATNGGDFIERAKRELGLYIRVVSARDEARLIYLAVRHALPMGDQPHLVIDVGGGSVEFIVGDGKRAALLESRKLGAARMTAKYVQSDPVAETELTALRRHYERELAPLCESILKLEPVKAIGTSGTLENIALMCGDSSPDDSKKNGNGNGDDAADGGESPPSRVLERASVERLVEKLVASNSSERASMRGLDDQRKDQIVAGVVLVDELMRRLKLKRIHVSSSALREGILLDYLARHIPELTIRREVPDARRRSVIDLARRCDWHKTHSEHVAGLCLKLFDELKAVHCLGDAERELIEYAALLHDIGWHIAGKGHHKHAMYLIQNGDLKNFAGEEVDVIANVARYHRKAAPKEKHEAYGRLSKPSQRIVDVGAALLRLADGLDRSHASVITGLRCDCGRKRIRCKLAARADAELEVWGARRKMDLFERVFDCEIVFVLSA